MNGESEDMIADGGLELCSVTFTTTFFPCTYHFVSLKIARRRSDPSRRRAWPSSRAIVTARSPITIAGHGDRRVGLYVREKRN